MTVITLESNVEEAYSYALSQRVEDAMCHHSDNERKAIRRLWGNESWKSIMRKFQTEGSVWYVWWMDGVHAYMRSEARKNKC